ncbi:MAG: sigma 54-interacting transcriptional regulator [Myxococcales bacterium]|nr:sigma 54-interacting transcriptional regulator [Myxococcales bacterium]
MSHADQTGSMSLDDGGAAGLGHDAALVLLWAENLAALPRGVALEPGTTVIGREPVGRGFRVVAPAVSRSHAAIEVGPRGCFIKDLGSRNGTRVGGVAIQHHALAHGDVVRIGDAVFVFVAHDGRRHLELDRADPARARGSSRVEGLVGGLSMDRLSQDVAGAIASGHAVLIQGETGVGKEIVARAIHEGSRRPGAFVAVNCPAIPSTLFESELFGHVRGAFTGASRDHLGLVRAADSGTLFLDEIGDMPPDGQAKILRFLETREVLPVGETRPVRVDVRVVSATHRDLAALATRGAFRGDLYARLFGYTVRVPPLRERREDLYLLVRHALERSGAPRLEATATVMERVALYDWPFNMRELIAVVGRAASLAEGGKLKADCFPAPAPRAPAEPALAADAAPPSRRPAPKRAELEELLVRERGNVSAVARALERDAALVYRWLKQHDLDPNAYRERG